MPSCFCARHKGIARMEEQLGSFLTSALDVDERSVSYPGCFVPGTDQPTQTQQETGRVSRAVWDVWQKRKIPCFCRDSDSGL